MLKRGLVAVALTGAGVGAAYAAIANVSPYATSLVPQYATKVVLSAGDTVPDGATPGREYRMVGIPDGLGAHLNADGSSTVYMNHELGSAVESEPRVGAAKQRGAFVSRLVVAKDGSVRSAARAFDTVAVDDAPAGPAAEVGNATRAFSRFCSGTLVGPAEGFDRRIYLAGEEDDVAANTFSGKGGSAVAIFDGVAHVLPSLGKASWENVVPQPNEGGRTVVMGMEDGPSALDPAKENSQLWMYVGSKDRSRGAGAVARNGLSGGTLYVFRAADRTVTGEDHFASGSIAGEWVAIPGAADMDAAQLEAAADAAGAMTFARPEDGTFNPNNRNQYFWVTTGGAAGANVLGRVYQLNLHPGNPTRPATLDLVVNADAVTAAGGDTTLSPDNVGVSWPYLMVQEDGTSDTRVKMAELKRDGSIWRFDITRRGIDASSATRVVTLSPPGRDGAAVKPGVWETSGIIATDRNFGSGTWLFDVQAQKPTAEPVPGTVEDGQLVLLTRTGR